MHLLIALCLSLLQGVSAADVLPIANIGYHSELGPSLELGGYAGAKGANGCPMTSIACGSSGGLGAVASVEPGWTGVLFKAGLGFHQVLDAVFVQAGYQVPWNGDAPAPGVDLRCMFLLLNLKLGYWWRDGGTVSWGLSAGF